MRTQTDVIDAEWEVLPPEEKDKRARLEPLFRWVAIVMDELIALPNSKVKFGLDPLIGLIPGIGDTASAIVSALVLIQAARRGLPKILLARMSLNILINEIVGLFFWWREKNKFRTITPGNRALVAAVN